MTSTLGCIGFDFVDRAEFETVVLRLSKWAYPLGSANGVEVLRWEDPSGARLVFGRSRDGFVDFVPSFAGRPGVLLRDCRAVSDAVVRADVVDSGGEQITAMAFELEQRRALGADERWSDAAAVTGFATTAEFFDDATAFARSPRSLLDPTAADDRAAPEHYLENGWEWPPRMVDQSFIGWGLFGEESDATAGAQLNGVVAHATIRRNTVTATRFLSARVRCLGFEIDLVTAWDLDDPPISGSIVAADVFLVASIDSLKFEDVGQPPRRRRWLSFGR